MDSSIENSIVLSIFKPNLPLLHQMITSLESQTRQSDLLIRCDEELDRYPTYAPLFHNLEVNYESEVGHYGYAISYSHLLQKVSASYIHFADQDDYWFPEKTERAQEILGTEEVVRLSYCRLEKNVLGKRIQRKQIRNSRNSKITFIFRNKVPGCTMSFTKKTNLLFQDVVNEFDQIKHHDWLMILIASLYGSVVSDNYVGVRYNIHASNSIGIPTLRIKAQRYIHQSYSQEVCPYWVLQGRAILRSITISNSNSKFLESCIDKHSKSRFERIKFLLTNGPLKASFIDIFYLVCLFVFPKKCSSCGGEMRFV